jgi:prepilin-type N-terminal cleavage/methylation domain-containing protein
MAPAPATRDLPMTHRPTPLRRTRGFTLIELMITVAIIGILARIALPSYLNYVTRAKLVSMTNRLAGLRTAMEQYYQDNRTYASVSSSIVSPCSDATYIKTYENYYALSCTVGTNGLTFVATVTASSGSASPAAYTVNQLNTQATTAFPSSWGSLPTNASCWLMRKGDSC